MGPLPTPLASLLLQESKPGLHEYNHALSSIDRYYTRFHKEMQEELVRDQILLNPSRALSRLQKSFEILKAKHLAASVSEEIFKSIVLRLIHPQDNILTLEQSVQLVGSALPLVTKHSSPYLRQAAEALLSFDGLVENLVAREKYAAVLKTWLLSKRNYLDVKLLMRMTETLMTMCNACSADHGTGTTSENWNKATALMESLQSLIRSSYEEDRKAKKTENLPPLEAMKVLGLDDKKSNQTHSDCKKVFMIPAVVLEGLRILRIPTLDSVRGLNHALEHLQNETIPSLMRAALESFPCRLCLERLTGHSVAGSKPADLPPDRTGTDTSPTYDIFGKRIGLWKVLLSDTALKSAKKLARAGAFHRVEQKLREIASGEWKGKDLSHRVSSKKQKHRMQVPILQVNVTRTVSILWQVDVGFYDELPWVQQQIVKVWEIVASEEELESAIEQILVLQKSYSQEFIHLCLKRPMQQSDGTFLPQRFGNVKAIGSSKRRCIDAPKTDQALIEMSNRFYNLTEPVLKSIVEATGREEFPFDLSPEEMEVVSHFSTSSLILGRSGTGKTTCLLFKILAKYRARQSIPDEQPIRQLLLTRSPYLASKLQTYARSLIDTQSCNMSAEDSSNSSKPTSFFTLQSDSFPFVCTYDEFLTLLETTIRRANRKDFLTDTSSRNSKDVDLQILDRTRVVDFNIFKTEYWGCLAGIAPTSCSPELLFAEIMGVIKGSSSCAKNLKSLTREEYLFKSAKASPAFASETEREKVYASFERYEKQKKFRKEIDELDRVSTLLKSLKDSSMLAQLIRRCFEEIYVDEIQDLRCLDIVLLLSCLCDARGIHLAGDTAQCISKDSVFRFPEIKALFYEYYDVIANELKQPCLAKPMQFLLAKNYRSHQGILSFASWVMQLLWNGFPETIDKLDPEIGQIGGPKPIIFAGFDSSILSAKMIGLVKLNDDVADFGAEQVILVRDDMAKDKLQARIGDIALVLTILESKGMEFDDVLVYDFFGSSGLGSSYRCLRLLAQGPRAQFDSQKHAALCSELKHLYVAVTRARKQLWFMETSESSVDPILQALSESDGLPLAELVKKKDHNVAEKVKVLRAGGSIDPERWLKRAAHLLHQKNFADALFCFKRANDSRGMAHSQACLYEQEGRTFRAANDIERFSACYEKAIALFLDIGLISEAASCFEGLGQYGKVAELWRDQGQYQKAAAFYEKASLFSDASDCYHSTGEYEQAIEVLRRGEQFDQLINYTSRNREILSASTLHRYSRLCNILLKQGRVSSELRATTINLLGSDADKLAFFKEFEMTDQLRSFYTSKGRWFEYYELSVSVGDLPSAVDTLLSHKLMPMVDRKTIEMIFQYALAEIFFARRGLIEDKPERDAILLKASKFTWLEKIALQWQAAFELIDSFKDENAPTSVRQLEGGFSKDFFCLFVIAFEMHIVNRSKIMHLPMDILMRAGKLLQNLGFGDKYSSACLSLLCGLFSNPKQAKDVVMLHWSPLKAEGVKGLSTEDSLSHAKRWVREKFAASVAQFDDSAFNLMKKESPKRCITLLVRGSCQKQRTKECPWVHEKPTHDTCVSKLTCLLHLSEVYARLTPLYLQRVMGEDFQKKFLGRRRRWLQSLQEELIFVTPLEQSVTAITTIRSHLQSNQDFLASVCCHEDFLFHRMDREWHDIHNFTSILEQVQQAHILGSQVAGRFSRALMRRMAFIISRSRSPSQPLITTMAGLVAAERIRSGVTRRQPSEFYSGVRDFLASVEKVEMAALSSFHALISVLEFATTYILCMVNPGNAIVIPWSWALLYLPTIMQSPFASDFELTEAEKLAHISCVKVIVSAFCKILDNVEFAINTYELAFSGMGRRNLPALILKRRSTDYLITVALNLTHWPNMPRGLAEIWAQMQKALAFSAPSGFTASGSFQRLREESIRMYTAYNGKDELHVICLDNSELPPLYLRGFIESHAQLAKLSTILNISRVAEKPVPTVFGSDTSNVDEYSGYELDMITNLQRRWRRVMRVLEGRRRMRETLEGQIVLSLDKLCSSKFNTLPGLSRLSAKDKIRLRKLLFTDGVRILVDLETVSTSLRWLRERWRYQFDQALSTAELEELDAIRGQIVHIDTKLDRIIDNWSIKGLGSVILLVSAHSLALKARDAQRSLWALRQEIEVVRSQVGTVARTS